MKPSYFLVIGSALSMGAFAQAPTQNSIPLDPVSRMPVSIMNQTDRTVKVLNFGQRGGTAKVSLAGTNLMPSAEGTAKVRSKRGTMEVEAEFGNLQSPKTFGEEYLTYVLWAISPDGRAVNLGEVLVGSNDRSKLTATTNLQAFALIVTAEPYFAVRQPSDVVVLEDTVAAGSRLASSAVDTKYELVQRGGYVPTGYTFDPVVLDAKLPLEFLEARNALRIARSEGAETYAGGTYQHAVQLMHTANEDATDGNTDTRQLILKSRATVQTAEDAREIAAKRIGEDRRENARQASAEAVAQSQAQANEATRQKEQAQSDAVEAQTEMAVNQVTSAVAINAAQADADQSRAMAMQTMQQADSEKAVLRAQLSARLNKVLETRDSARGLIVSMSDVLFATGEYALTPGAKEKLAKVAGILIAYPSLNIAVGGYTDNVGSNERNQTLSESRADAVRDYLVEEGVVGSSVTAEGYGEASPVASNDDLTGRQENRRVELVVSGDAIGSPANVTTGSLR